MKNENFVKGLNKLRESVGKSDNAAMEIINLCAAIEENTEPEDCFGEFEKGLHAWFKANNVSGNVFLQFGGEYISVPVKGDVKFADTGINSYVSHVRAWYRLDQNFTGVNERGEREALFTSWGEFKAELKALKSALKPQAPEEDKEDKEARELFADLWAHDKDALLNTLRRLAREKAEASIPLAA